MLEVKLNKFDLNTYTKLCQHVAGTSLDFNDSIYENKSWRDKTRMIS